MKYNWISAVQTKKGRKVKFFENTNDGPPAFCTLNLIHFQWLILYPHFITVESKTERLNSMSQVTQ